MAGRSRRHAHGAEHESEERWLLTYADMITLLMALFMVLFSISSVNISKYRTLQQSLKAAFSGSILPGGKSVLQAGASNSAEHVPAAHDIPAIVPLNPTRATPGAISSQTLHAALQSALATATEQQNFKDLKERLDSYARAHGFSSRVQAVVERRGLVVRVLTDKLLFASGSATLQGTGLPLLNQVAALLKLDHQHPITVEGHTDNTPIASAQFPSNWELSTGRATNVLRYLIGQGVDRSRLAAAGFADTHPVAGNDTDAGRAANRRVEIVFQRLNPTPS